jgi:4-oxalocrotonate tautomerase
MPLIQISVPAGSLSPEQKRAMVERITDVIVDVEGIPAVRAGTWVHINEVPDGGWGIAGRALTLADLQAALQPRAERR